MEDDAKLIAIQVKNHKYLGLIAPQIKAFLDRAPEPNVRYETLYYFLECSVQHGINMSPIGMRDASELWVICEQEKESVPIALAHWHIRPPPCPAVGAARCDYIYSWNRKKEPVRMLMKEFVKFAKDHRCTLIDATLANEAVFKVFNKIATDLGYKFERLPTINIAVRGF